MRSQRRGTRSVSSEIATELAYNDLLAHLCRPRLVDELFEPLHVRRSAGAADRRPRLMYSFAQP